MPVTTGDSAVTGRPGLRAATRPLLLAVKDGHPSARRWILAMIHLQGDRMGDEPGRGRREALDLGARQRPREWADVGRTVGSSAHVPSIQVKDVPDPVHATL